MSVVAHTDEQPATVGIGKGRNGTCQLLGILDLVFEVLLLVLTLAD
jgi:hypothetical protein